MIAAGELKHRLILQQAVETRSASGALTEDWSAPVEVGKRWARILNGSVREVYAARQVNPEVDSVITCRGFLAITEKMRWTHADGRKWDILGIRTADGKSPLLSDEIETVCREGHRKGS